MLHRHQRPQYQTS
ncbi:hypothetical protein D047_1967B, partial [Vibrio parahaemolyticus VPTS-2010_2]